MAMLTLQWQEQGGSRKTAGVDGVDQVVPACDQLSSCCYVVSQERGALQRKEEMASCEAQEAQLKVALEVAV